MRSVETDWWILDLPDEWEAEQEDETIVLTDPDGVGALEITTLLRAEMEGPNDAASLAGELVPDSAARSVCTIAGLSGHCYSYIDEGDAVRDWLVSNDELLLLITYSCDAEHQGLDDALIEEIIATVELKNAP
ncbi:MAG: hypothetical protein RBS88_06360 [Spongiibacteraceae bacterium]|jgi:hypothetical protein|nr:hypothetical protein [Spongiibacteraceae bacterium]